VKLEEVLCFPILQPVESHIHCLCLFGLYFSINDAMSCRIVGLDGSSALTVSYSSKVCRIGTASFVLMNNAPSSACAADDMTNFMTCATFSTAPLSGSVSLCFLVKKKWLPALLRALGSLRYDTSLWMTSFVSLAFYVATALSCDRGSSP
jgi:hypothetical protein